MDFLCLKCELFFQRYGMSFSLKIRKESYTEISCDVYVTPDRFKKKTFHKKTCMNGQSTMKYETKSVKKLHLWIYSVSK